MKFDYYRATRLLGDVYARKDDLERAAYYFAPAIQYSTTTVQKELAQKA